MNTFTQAIDSSTLAILRMSSYLNAALNYADELQLTLKQGSSLYYFAPREGANGFVVLPSNYFFNNKLSFNSPVSSTNPTEIIRGLSHELGHVIDTVLASDPSKFANMQSYVIAEAADEVEAIFMEYIVMRQLPENYQFTLSGGYLSKGQLIQPWVDRFDVVMKKYNNNFEAARAVVGKMFASAQYNMTPSTSLTDTYKTLNEKYYMASILGLDTIVSLPRSYLKYDINTEGTQSVQVYLGSFPDSPGIVNYLLVEKSSKNVYKAYEIFKNTANNSEVKYEIPMPTWQRKVPSGTSGPTTWETTLPSGNVVSLAEEENLTDVEATSSATIDIIYQDSTGASLEQSADVTLSALDLSGADILVVGVPDLTFAREGTSLIVQYVTPEGSKLVRLTEWFTNGTVPSITLWAAHRLDNATTSYDAGYITEQALIQYIEPNATTLYGELIHYQETLIGNDENNLIYASQAVDENSVGDILVGGIGDDYLYGSIGGDKVRIGAGDGKDVFRGNGGADIVETYGGISFTHTYTKLDKVGADLRATFIDGTQLTIRDWDVEGKLMAFREGRDGSLIGYDWVNQNLDSFYGDAGVNVITGTTSANELYGYGGADRLVGGGGNDKFWGGTGNDELVGGTGNDTFYYELGDGIDHIWGGGGSDVLDFQASGQGRPLTASRVGNDIKFSYSASDSVTVHDWFSNAGAAMSVKLPNGQMLSSSQVNAGFTMMLPRWMGDYKINSDFQREIYKVLPGSSGLDYFSITSKGYSFFVNSFANGYGLRQNFTGHYHGDEKIYKGALAMAQSGYGYVHLTWEYWKAGPGAYKFVITGGESGRTGNGASYAFTGENNLNAIRSNPSIEFIPQAYYSKSWTDIPISIDSFQLYNGNYAQPATSLSLYDIDSFSIESNDNVYAAAVGSNMAEIVGGSNPELVYLA